MRLSQSVWVVFVKELQDALRDRALDRLQQRVFIQRREDDARHTLAREALDDLHLLLPVVFAERSLPDDLHGIARSGEPSRSKAV